MVITYPSIDPIALSLGPLKIHWYGLMYLLGFAAFWWLGTLRARRDDYTIKPEQVGDMLFYAALGVILGGRLGYLLFYGFAEVVKDPLSAFRVWEGGMSYHGGLIGVLIATWLYARKIGARFFNLTDFGAPMVPMGLFFGRLGNFINGELWGRPTSGDWGMIFPHVDNLPRHPSQLYEAGLEGIVMFIVLWRFSALPRRTGAVSGLFLILYGTFRFTVEFFREPDVQLGFIALNWLTMGQLLSLPMIVAGVAIVLWSRRPENAVAAA